VEIFFHSCAFEGSCERLTGAVLSRSMPAMARTSRYDYLIGLLLVLLATVGWSLAGLFVRLVPELNGWQINSWRGLFLALFLLAYLIAVYGRGWIDRFRAIPTTAMIACAGFFAAGSTLYVTSLTLTGTANVSCIGALAPLFVAAAGSVFLGERTGTATWIAAVVALLGAAIIFHDGLTNGTWLGSFVAILVALCFAGQTLVLRRYRRFDMMPSICLGGLIAFFSAALFTGGLSASPAQIAVLALMGPVQLAIPLIFFAKGARHVQATTLSLIALLDVVLNPFWSWMGVGEAPPRSAVAGGAIIVGAVAMSILAGEKLNWRPRLLRRLRIGR
jgi:drug/metabolite transporter, DME family